MKTAEIRMKETQLSMLDEIDTFCKTNNIKYYLAYGTLLGAIRHKGYIPWDDDVDIWMFRKDYEIFLKEFKSEKCEAINCNNTKKYYLPFGKVCDKNSILKEEINSKYPLGIYIDIFPLDNIPDDMNELKKIYKKIDRLNKLLTIKLLKIKRKTFLKSCIVFFSRFITMFINSNSLSKKIDNLSQKYNKIPTKRVSVFYYFSEMKYGLEKKMFKDSKYMEFEENKYLIPAEYDKILKTIYGDYMTLPPEEKRQSHHCYKLTFKSELRSK